MVHRTRLARPCDRRRLTASILALAVLLTCHWSLAQDALAGSYGDGRLSVTVQGGAGQYAGEIHLDGQAFPISAQGTPERIDGTFAVGADRFPFSAGLQGDVLVLSTGGATYHLARQAPGRQDEPGPVAQAAAGLVQPGVRLTYEVQVASHPGTNSGPDARGSGGSGLRQVDVLHVGADLCVANRLELLYSPLDGSITPSTDQGGVIVDRSGACWEFWWPPEQVASYAPPPGTSQQVGRGPYQFGQGGQGGQEVEALFVSEEDAERRFSVAIDVASGIMLHFTEGTGPRTVPAPGPTYSSSTRLVAVRQRDFPWDLRAPLPASVRDVQDVTIRYQTTMDGASGSFPGSATTDRGQSRLTVAERHPNLLLLRPADAGAPASQDQPGYVALASDATLLVPPAAIAGLRPGQLLDADPASGYRIEVERVDGTALVLVTRGRGYEARARFDPRTGLLVSQSAWQNDGAMVLEVQMELDWR